MSFPQLLQKMIEDRLPSVQSVKETGKQLLSGLEGSEHERMSDEMKGLEKRWVSLTEEVKQRNVTLETMADLAKKFQEIHEPLAVWLDVANKKFTALEPKSADTEGIEKLISDLKVR